MSARSRHELVAVVSIRHALPRTFVVRVLRSGVLRRAAVAASSADDPGLVLTAHMNAAHWRRARGARVPRLPPLVDIEARVCAGRA